jgi:hypothetical protein
MIDSFCILILLFAILALIVMYIPASLELTKPRDNGPRIIEASLQPNKNSITLEMET